MAWPGLNYATAPGLLILEGRRCSRGERGWMGLVVRLRAVDGPKGSLSSRSQFRYHKYSRVEDPSGVVSLPVEAGSRVIRFSGGFNKLLVEELRHMSDQNDSLVERVNELLPSLAATAADLNEASEKLSEVIDRIDGALQRLNLGVTAWTVVTQGGSSVDGNGTQYRSEDLGYGRTGRKSWGLMLRKGESDYQIPDSGQYDEWPFNEAPRDLRIMAVKQIPNLLKKLDLLSREMVKNLSASIEETVAIVGALEQAARPQRSIKGKPGRRS